MNPARRRPDRFGYILEKSDNVVVSSPFDFEDLRNREPRPFSNLSSVLFRNLAKLCHCLAGEHFNFQPDFKFALVRPDFAHLRPGITVNHAGNIKATAVSEKRFRPRWPKNSGVAWGAARWCEKESPLMTADATALHPLQSELCLGLISKRGRAGSVRYLARVPCRS